MFLVENKPETITLFWNSVEDFYTKVAMPIPGDQNQVVYDMLSKVGLKILFDRKFHCVGFK